MKAASPARVIYSREALLAWMARVKAALPSGAAEDVAILAMVVHTYLFLVDALSKARVRLGRLKRWLFGGRSERKDALFPPEGQNDGGSRSGRRGGSSGDGRRGSKNGAPGEKGRKGHGRLGTKDYPGAQRLPLLLHPTFEPGCPCPDEKCKGKVYRIKKPREIPRFFGQALLIVKIWLQELWRCNLCEKVLGAPLPPEATGDKYDVSAVVMLAVARFAYGLPAYRLQQHQASAGVPIAASVQMALLRGAYEKLAPLFDEFIRQAAQFDVLQNDDTGMKILELLAKIKRQQPSPDAATSSKKKKLRTGIHTTGIVAVSLAHGYQIALYFTGRQHAGENLADVLAKRAPGLPPPIHTSDGLDYNKPKDIKVITTKCNVHARRQFADIKSSFPEQCRYVIERIAEVYHVDDLAKERGLSAEERLLLHQEKSGPVMDSLRRWLVDQLLEGIEEPNSELGQAIKYMLRLWEPLTKFLRVPGVPLDTNSVERILKAAIRHRKNSLFFKTAKGAQVGDFFMSLFETCHLNGVDKVHYLTTVLSNVERVREAPGSWMPWNYRAMLPKPTDTTATESPAAGLEAPVASRTPEAAHHEESAPRPASQPGASGHAPSVQEPGRSGSAGDPSRSSNSRSRKPASPASPVVRSETAPSSRERKSPESTTASPPPGSPRRGPSRRARPDEARSPT